MLFSILLVYRDTKLFVYGGDGSSKQESTRNGYSLEIDLVPLWAHKHRKGRKKMMKQIQKEKKSGDHTKSVVETKDRQ